MAAQQDVQVRFYQVLTLFGQSSDLNSTCTVNNISVCCISYFLIADSKTPNFITPVVTAGLFSLGQRWEVHSMAELLKVGLR